MALSVLPSQGELVAMIIYHGMPTGLTVPDDLRVFHGRHLFVSYATGKAKLARYVQTAAEVCLDNGAFSYWTSGRSYDFAGYLEWVEAALEFKNVGWAVIPDLIDGSEDENDDQIREWPEAFPGVPVWHMHESLDRLQRLCHTWPRVALGSSGSVSTPGTPDWWRRLAQAWEVIPTHTRIHGLRMAAEEIVTRVPLSSADSTTAGRNAHLEAKRREPFKRCKPATMVQAYCESMETADFARALRLPSEASQLTFDVRVDG